jgi:pimeloyl-ACP methyl ester carboxylesterase
LQRALRAACAMHAGTAPTHARYRGGEDWRHVDRNRRWSPAMHPDPDPVPPVPFVPLVPGVPVVALHSSGAGARQWAPWRPLWPAGTAVVMPDLIGYADAPGGAPPRAVTLDDEAQRIAGLVDARRGGVHIVGHSYGGAVALRLALRWPDRVRSLWLYEPVLFALLRGGDEPAWHDIVSAGRAIGALARSGRLDDSGAMFVDYWSGRGTWAALPAARRRAVAERMPKVVAEFDALFDDDVAPTAYRAVNAPVHLLAGTRSPRPARRVAQRLATLLPSVRLQALHGLGHMGPLADPQRVAAAFGLAPVGAEAPALA